MAGRPRCCLQPDCSPGTRSSMAPEVTSMLSAGAVSREGFPRGLIVGVMQSLQLRSAETFRHRDFSGIFCPLDRAASLLGCEIPWGITRAFSNRSRWMGDAVLARTPQRAGAQRRGEREQQ